MKSFKRAAIFGILFTSAVMFATSVSATMNPDDLPDGSVYIGNPNAVVQMKHVKQRNVFQSPTIAKERLAKACGRGKIWYPKGGYCINKFD
ncbi:MAG: hypothetical protein D6B25_08690 [Desulfobulbaceae bacterium]|nr:MAG: hypothetical protein D6B25_08690 [Desulfobulbaceae bacterium]